jgi:hypothetical protein
MLSKPTELSETNPGFDSVEQLMYNEMAKYE